MLANTSHSSSAAAGLAAGRALGCCCCCCWAPAAWEGPCCLPAGGDGACCCLAAGGWPASCFASCFTSCFASCLAAAARLLLPSLATCCPAGDAAAAGSAFGSGFASTFTSAFTAALASALGSGLASAAAGAAGGSLRCGRRLAGFSAEPSSLPLPSAGWSGSINGRVVGPGAEATNVVTGCSLKDASAIAPCLAEHWPASSQHSGWCSCPTHPPHTYPFTTLLCPAHRAAMHSPDPLSSSSSSSSLLLPLLRPRRSQAHICRRFSSRPPLLPRRGDATAAPSSSEAAPCGEGG